MFFCLSKVLGDHKPPELLQYPFRTDCTILWKMYWRNERHSSKEFPSADDLRALYNTSPAPERYRALLPSSVIETVTQDRTEAGPGDSIAPPYGSESCAWHLVSCTCSKFGKNVGYPKTNKSVTYTLLATPNKEVNSFGSGALHFFLVRYISTSSS